MDDLVDVMYYTYLSYFDCERGGHACTVAEFPQLVGKGYDAQEALADVQQQILEQQTKFGNNPDPKDRYYTCTRFTVIAYNSNWETYRHAGNSEFEMQRFETYEDAVAYIEKLEYEKMLGGWDEIEMFLGSPIDFDKSNIRAKAQARFEQEARRKAELATVAKKKAAEETAAKKKAEELAQLKMLREKYGDQR